MAEGSGVERIAANIIEDCWHLASTQKNAAHFPNTLDRQMPNAVAIVRGPKNDSVINVVYCVHGVDRTILTFGLVVGRR